jgi:hypothetical protein
MITSTFRNSLLLCCLLTANSNAQLGKAFDYFPLQVGNIWEYDADRRPQERLEIVSDTTAVDGIRYYEMLITHPNAPGIRSFSYHHYNADSTKVYQVGSQIGNEEWLFMDVSKGINQPWFDHSDTSSDASMLGISGAGQTELFGKTWETITIQPASIINDSVVFNPDAYAIYAKGLGKIVSGGGLWLVYARIAGVEYGTPLTSVDDNQGLHHYSSWPFYPLSRGNFWRYQMSFNGGVWGYNRETIVDSLEIQGQWFLEKQIQEYTGGLSSTYLRQEDSTCIMERSSLGQNVSLGCLYKIDAVVGETWLVEDTSDSSYKFWGKLELNDSTEIFGEIRQSKHYRFWRESNGHLGSEWFTVLTKGLGMTTLRGGNGGADLQDMDLVGAIINGIEFGNPTAVDENPKVSPTPDIFLINYPNPFATSTTIEVDMRGIGTKRAVQIIVYNLIGQRLRTVYYGVLTPNQRFLTKWDGTDDFAQRVPTGIYFLQMRTGNVIRTKRIFVVR